MAYTMVILQIKNSQVITEIDTQKDNIEEYIQSSNQVLDVVVCKTNII